MANSLRKLKSIVVLSVLVTCFGSNSALARLLQIIHTNDLHSHFEEGSDFTRGSYAAVKAKIDEIKANARAQGIDTLILDAGDFSEGTGFFLADKGEDSWHLLDSMGYDAVTLGNHDYLMGQTDLNRIVNHTNPHMPILAANFEPYSNTPDLKKHFAPYAIFRKAGMKVAVLGLTTDEFVFTWRAGADRIYSPMMAADLYLPEIRKRADVVIALTHIGKSKDIELVKNRTGIDLVVGGHSHSFLYDYIAQKDRKGRVVPIVQTGDRGHNVGNLLVDIEPGKEVKVITYRLEPVFKDGPKDPVIAAKVLETRRKIEEQYGHDWFTRPIAFSEIPMVAPAAGPTPWGDVYARALRTAGQADFSLDHTDLLFGTDQRGGPVTREMLFNFYPRVFTFDQHLGWTVWTAKTWGWLIKLAIRETLRRGFRFNLDGITYDVVGPRGKENLKNFKINGRSLRSWHSYKMAIPDGIGRGMKDISPLFHLLFRSTKDTKIPIMTAVESRLQEMGGVVRAPASEGEHEHLH